VTGPVAAAKRIVKTLLRAIGLELRRHRLHDWADPRTYLPFAPTLRDATVAGMSVGDYIETKYNVEGAAQATMDQLAALGVFSGSIQHVCEIGPGSGRYLEKTLTTCHPSLYEIYETATEWAAWLVRTYGVMLRPTDGRTLSATASRSVDLVHAHKVMAVTPTLVTCSYLAEMARVVRPGGKVVFDVMTERCMEDSTIEGYLEGETGAARHGVYPAMMPRQFVIDFLLRRGLLLLGSFLVINAPGFTECMAFVLPG
jgi:hypothetical protein